MIGSKRKKIVLCKEGVYMKNEKEIREFLVTNLEGSWSHVGFSRAIDGFPKELRTKRVEHLDHTAWDLVYHMRAAQRDIIEFISSNNYEERSYPSGYWPKDKPECSENEWDEVVHAFQDDLEVMSKIILDDSMDLFSPLPNGNGQNLMREAMVIGNHNSYHIGQLIDIRMLLAVPVRDW